MSDQVEPGAAPAAEFYAHTPPDDDPTRWHKLYDHLKEVATLAAGYARPFDAERLAELCGWLHDAGKYSDEFQAYLRACHDAKLSGRLPPKAGIAEHKAAGTEYALAAFPGTTVGRILALCVLGHHGGLVANDSVLTEQAYRVQKAANIAVPISRAVAATPIGNVAAQVPNAPTFRTPPAPGTAKHAIEMLARFVFSCLVDADSLDTERHYEPDSSELRQPRFRLPEGAENWQERLSSHVRGLSGGDVAVRRVRREVYESCLQAAALPRGVFSLVVPTGGGKTLSSLAFAVEHIRRNGLRRVIYVIPYTSIIDQTAAVFRSVLGDDVVLEHHSAIDWRKDMSNPVETESDEEIARRLAAENWDAPLVVTTYVQFFESLFSNRTARCRKLHNIVDSVIVLDEVQTLPGPLLTPLVSGMTSLVRDFGATIVLCSATLPALSGESEYLKGFDKVRPVITDPKPHFEALKRVRYRIERETWTWDRVAKEILAQNSSSLTVLNTKKDALAVLKEVGRQENVLHLSTLLCGAHRRKVIGKIILALNAERAGNGGPIHVISTQVVEAGCDFDFPRVLRARGPLDRIIQCAGRCNREGLRPREQSEVVIFMPAEGGRPTGMYQIECEEADRFLASALGERDLGDPDVPTEYFARLYDLLAADGLDRSDVQGSRNRFDFPETSRRVRLIDQDTVPVLCRYGDGRVDAMIEQIRWRSRLKLPMSRAIWQLIQPYTVAVATWDLRRAESDGKAEPLVGDDLYLWTGGYDSITGIGGDVVYDPADLVT